MKVKGSSGMGSLNVNQNEAEKCIMTTKYGSERCKIMHYPTLETVMMVEETIKRIGPATLSKIHRSTEKQVMWSTLRLIVEYLESRNMVATDREDKIEIGRAHV